MPFLNIIYPEDRQKAMQYYRARVSDSIVSDSYSLRIASKSGEMRWVAVNATQIQWEGRRASLAMLSDITEQKQAEQELKTSENKFYKVFQASRLIYQIK